MFPTINKFMILCIRQLERVLAATRLQFKKITIMTKGQSPKLKGKICNVPVNLVRTYNI